mmetsp:Transcript_1215/g.2770  ORF Transcript_1215/g.2770 Transcript_1215/m.2770 type:complete len:204 (+) Transcript_1215:1241-1852(+)
MSMARRATSSNLSAVSADWPRGSRVALITAPFGAYRAARGQLCSSATWSRTAIKVFVVKRCAGSRSSAPDQKRHSGTCLKRLGSVNRAFHRPGSASRARPSRCHAEKRSTAYNVVAAVQYKSCSTVNATSCATTSGGAIAKSKCVALPAACMSATPKSASLATYGNDESAGAPSTAASRTFDGLMSRCAMAYALSNSSASHKP